MKKYIAFELFKKNDEGGHQPVFKARPDGFNVCLVSDVEDLLWKIESSDNPKLVAGTALKALMET